MKIYQIAGKQYAVSGDDLYEKVPESSLLEPQSEEDSVSTFAFKRKKYKTREPKKAKSGQKGKTHCKVAAVMATSPKPVPSATATCRWTKSR
jgi:hypothetical protein